MLLVALALLGIEKKKVKKKQSRNGAADYDVLLDGIMKKMLADG